MKFMAPFLSKIKITEGNRSSLLKGSIGFITYIYITGPHNNILENEILVTRHGKNGKFRLQFQTFNTEIVDSTHMSDKQKELMTSQTAEKLGLCAPGVVYDGKFKTVPITRNITKLTSGDFLAYVGAFSTMLNNLNSYNNVIMHRNDYIRPLNLNKRFIRTHDPCSIGPLDIGRAIMSAYMWDEEERTDEFLNIFANSFKSIENRIIVLNELYKKSVALRDRITELLSLFNSYKTRVSNQVHEYFTANNAD